MLVTRESAAAKYAAANKTDPFAYDRIMNDMKDGRENAFHVQADAERIIKHAPVNPVMIAAAQKAGLL